MKAIDGLNPEQRQAVTHGDGPLLIIAGAGTGKTKVITHRIAHLIESGQAKPDEILALTFTEKAASEMQDRIYDLLPLGQAPNHVSTFHSFGKNLLEDHSLELGIPPGFKVMNEQQQALLLREHLFELPLQKLRPRGNPTKHLQALVKVFSRAKDEDVDAATYAAKVQEMATRLEQTTDPDIRAELEHELSYQREITATYTFYEERKAERYLLDFADEVFLAYRLLRDHPVILKRLQKQFRYVLVDEFQDTNVVQYRLVKLLAGAAANLTVVGDDDQSIYSFRGADLQNLLQFEEDFQQPVRVVLQRNYRSSQAILDASYRLIRHNDPERLEVKDKIDKKLVAAEPAGPEPVFLPAGTIRDEANGIAEVLAARHAAGIPLSELAVLIPKRSLTPLIQQALTARDLPVVYEEAGGLYDRPEIQMCISLLRVVANRHQSWHVAKLARSELYQLPQVDLDKLGREHHKTNAEWWDLLTEMTEGVYSGEGVARAARLQADVTKLAAGEADASVAQLLWRWFAEQTGYLEDLRELRVPDAGLKAQNLNRFFRRLTEFTDTAEDSTATAWLRYFDETRDLTEERASSELDYDQDAVRIMTIHQAKGLEFDTVVVAGCAKNIFPKKRQTDLLNCEFVYVHPPSEEGDYREQRRLMYVAMTRARRYLALSAATYYDRGGKKQLSPFVVEALGDHAAGQVIVPDTNPLKAIDEHAPSPNLPPHEGLPEPLKLSVTQIDDYLTCPRRFYWKHIARAFEEPTHHQAYGNLIHSLVQEISQAHVDGRTVPLEIILQQYETAWQNEYYLSKEHEAESYATGLDTLKRFHAAEISRPPAAAIEQDFSFKVGGVLVYGRYDRVERVGDSTTLVDYKTTAVSTQSAADTKSKDSRQLTMYAMALYQTTGTLPESVALHYVDSGLVGASARTLKQLQNMEEKIAAVATGVRTNHYPTTETDHYCANTPMNDCPGNKLKHPRSA